MQTAARSYDATNQVVGWQYDAAGNLLSDGTSRWSYDALGRMIAAGRGLETRTYTYNGDGVLVAETSGGSTTRYAQDLAAPLSQVLQIQQGASTSRVVYGEDRLFSVADGVRRWYGADALGSVRQTWDEAGAPSSQVWYDPWGQVEQGSVPAFGFTGELHDAAFDMVHLRARWYNPTHGTFTAARWRTSESSPYVPLSNHVYAYALANPVNWTDPTGKCIPYLDRDCLPVWEIGQGANGEDFGNYWFTVGNTVKDTVVGPAQMLYEAVPNLRVLIAKDRPEFLFLNLTRESARKLLSHINLCGGRDLVVDANYREPMIDLERASQIAENYLLQKQQSHPNVHFEAVKLV